MIDEVIVFTGSKRDFNSLLQERIDTENDEVVSFMELHKQEKNIGAIYL